MKPTWLFAMGGIVVAIAAWQGALALQAVLPKPLASPPVTSASPLTTNVATGLELPKTPALSAKTTPMAERVATIGLLNKRNGLWRDIVIKPGDAVRIGDVVVRVKACETTAPWEAEQLTGAFVQVIVNGSDKKWRRAFSGWLYKESPSLNVVEHSIYDVWAKDCAMRHPDTGADTVVVRSGDSGDPSNAPSKAKKSAPRASVGPVAEPAPADDSADDSNVI